MKADEMHFFFSFIW